MASTRITTSAASDDALAPRTPIADAHIGGREGRRIIDAVADHQRRLEPPLHRNRRDLVSRVAIGKHGV